MKNGTKKFQNNAKRFIYVELPPGKEMKWSHLWIDGKLYDITQVFVTCDDGNPNSSKGAEHVGAKNKQPGNSIDAWELSPNSLHLLKRKKRNLTGSAAHH